MKTHDRETGDLGCRAVIFKHFCSTASFWKSKTFITLLTGNKISVPVGKADGRLMNCPHFLWRGVADSVVVRPRTLRSRLRPRTLKFFRGQGHASRGQGQRACFPISV